MPQETVSLPAVILPPSDYPYRFTELINFRGDFDEEVRPGQVVNPKGVAYHGGLDRLIVSLSPFNVNLESQSQILNAVSRDGSRARFAPGYRMFRRVESKIAIVPESGPPVAAGFIPGEIFLGRGPNTEVSRLSSGGQIISDIWTSFGPGGGLWGGLAFDNEGEFGGRLIAVEANGAIYLVDPDGTHTLLVNLQKRLEGVAIAPTTFGPFAKNVIVGVEGYNDDDPHGGEILAIGPDAGIAMIANIGYAAENIIFIPSSGGTFYQAQLAFDRERENRLLCVSASQFLNRLGRMIVVNEMTGELWEVAWDGTHYTQQNTGRVPGRWSTAGFYVQGTELEAGCFAVKAPRIPDWTNWQVVPGGFTTDRAPAAATNAAGELTIFGKQVNDQEVYLNSIDRSLSPDTANVIPEPDGDLDWRGWQPDPQRIVTQHSPACSLHNNRMYAFAVQADGQIAHKYYTPDQDENSIQPWQTVPGGVLTNTSVACATVNGRLVLSAIGQDQQIYLNELAPGGRYWSGWYLLPGGGQTDVTPTVTSFQDELYILIKGLTSGRILLKTRTIDGEWTPWAEIPGNGRTNSSITAVSTGGQLFIFVSGTDHFPYVNVASETGTWSGWGALPNPGVTDTSMAAAAAGDRVYLFAKGIDDRQLYVRSAKLLE